MRGFASLALLVLEACAAPAAPTAVTVDIAPPSPADTPLAVSSSAAEPPATANFDRDAAIAAFDEIDVERCAQPLGPTGPGRVIVTFDASGVATSANVDRAPYAGTAVGDCLAAAFGTARIPPFTGTPSMRLTKIFVLR